MPGILLLGAIAMIAPVIAYFVTPELGMFTPTPDQHPAITEGLARHSQLTGTAFALVLGAIIGLWGACAGLSWQRMAGPTMFVTVVLAPANAVSWLWLHELGQGTGAGIITPTTIGMALGAAPILLWARGERKASQA